MTHHHRGLVPAASLILAVAVAGLLAQESLPSAAPSIEGTYILVSRDLPDESVQEPPEVQGLLTYTESHRNFNVMWRDAEGNTTSLSSIALYELSETEYTETNLFWIANDEILGEGLRMDVEEHTASSPVTWDGSRLEWDLPLHDEPHIAHEGEGFTATVEGLFVDHWRRVD